MYRVPPARAWWPAVGAPLERGVRQHPPHGDDVRVLLACATVRGTEAGGEQSRYSASAASAKKLGRLRFAMLRREVAFARRIQAAGSGTGCEFNHAMAFVSGQPRQSEPSSSQSHSSDIGVVLGQRHEDDVSPVCHGGFLRSQGRWFELCCLTFELSWHQRRGALDSKRKMGRRPSA